MASPVLGEGWWKSMPERVGNITRLRYEQIVTEARELVARARFALGEQALAVEPMRPAGGWMPNGTDDLFTVGRWPALFIDDIGSLPRR
ncbi:hypothetical protein [Streptomyces sp. NPDC058701]|uniref:hypothetical protein n=1 Tax=Streptomyces sp. NPDC058701 TaxID=3346608 RepID=UPI00365482E1